jgi:hypothetical protein
MTVTHTSHTKILAHRRIQSPSYNQPDGPPNDSTHRDTETTLCDLAQGYPVLALASPRQPAPVVRTDFPTRPYFTQEMPAKCEFAQTDPQGFLKK